MASRFSPAAARAVALWVLGVLALALAHPAMAGDWRRLLLEASPEHQTLWGQRYEHGEGVERDLDRAVRLYCAAARRDHAEAQYRLGWLYANARGVERDDALAAAWFRLAAANGDGHARRMVERLDGGGERPALCISPGRAEPVVGIGSGLDSREDIELAVAILAPRYALDPALVVAVIEAESAFQVTARSSKGAVGLMQLMPGTARRFGVEDRLDPLQNLQGGMAYLRWLLDHFEGDVALALAGYNAGEGAVARHGGIPPYRETRGYVRRITASYPHATHPDLPMAAGAAEPTEGRGAPS